MCCSRSGRASCSEELDRGAEEALKPGLVQPLGSVLGFRGQKLVQHSSIGVAFVLCKARIEVFPGRVAADRMQKGLGVQGLGFRAQFSSLHKSRLGP